MTHRAVFFVDRLGFRQQRPSDFGGRIVAFQKLGAGTHPAVMDYFMVGENGLVVITPEPTAIENAEHFLRAAFYRSLRVATRKPEVRAAVLRVKEDRSMPRMGSALDLLARVKKIDPTAAKLLADLGLGRAQADDAQELKQLEDEIGKLEQLRADWARATACLADKGGLWVAWPKKSSGIGSDLTQQIVRRTAEAAGLVDYKIIAIDATWSGLLFTRRAGGPKG